MTPALRSISSPLQISSAPAKPAPRRHARDWSKTQACSLRSGAPARPGQMRWESKKVQRPSATRSLLERKSPRGSRSYGGPGSQDGCARRHSANKVPYFTTGKVPTGRIISRDSIFHNRTKPLFSVSSSALPRPDTGVYCWLGVLGPRLPSTTLGNCRLVARTKVPRCVRSPYQAVS
jgi:hypothetical protein